jgi:shikimate kinase
MNATHNSDITGAGRKIFLIGFMGSGKTYWGRVWAAAAGLDFFDLDELVEKEAGCSIVDLFEKKGEEQFRSMETSQLRSFAGRDNFLLSCGGGAPCYRDNMQWMNQHGITICLSATPAFIYDKVAEEKDKRPLLKKISPGELLFFIEKKLKEREVYYNQAKFTLDVNELEKNSLLALNL